jgi:uncharacterized protein YprB with RNaseH-like and TPR domain
LQRLDSLSNVATMIDETLRNRLEALNRGPMPAQVARPHINSEATSAAGRTALRLHISTPPRPTPTPAKHTSGLLHSGDIVETSHGPHLRIRIPLENLWPNGTQLIASRQEFLQSRLAAAQLAIEPSLVLEPDFASLVGALPERAVGLDLETCGLAGSALFLIGLFRQIDGLPMIELLLARNYSEEPAVLATLWQTIADHHVLLTFNGKTFDWPMVIERCVRHRLKLNGQTSEFLHIDVLHHARRRWRKQLPNCRLQTLEQHVCRRHRIDDVPGHRIPAVYAHYVRTGFEREMDQVLHHNALDLVTLFDLALRLAA